MKMIISNKVVVKEMSPYWISALTELFTLDNPEYLTAKERLMRQKSKRKVFGIPKKLYFFKKFKDSCAFPRGAAGLIQQTVQQKEKLEIIDHTFFLPEIDFTFQKTLRPYQDPAVKDILSKRFGVLEAGTGAGKTVMALAIIAKRKQPTLIIVHTKELLYQWKERIKSFLNVDCGLIGDGNLTIKPITVAIVNSAKNHIEELVKNFGHLIIDECHRVPSTLFKNVVSNFPCGFMLGLSATPYRNDGLGDIIGWYVGHHKVVVDQEELRECGAVLVPNIIIRETSFGYRSKNSDYQAVLFDLINNKERNDMIIADIRNEAKIGNISLVVSDRIGHLFTLAEKLKVKSEMLTGGTRPEIRKEIIEKLAQGEIKILFSTTQLIGEGFDCPGLTNLFITMPIKYEGKLTQIIGRILRPSEGKEPNVYDYFDQFVPMLRKQGLSRQKMYKEMWG
jgi:superfamily II DNA or RNA helicase